MRDPNRIEPMLKEIGEIWKKYPDLRLCQLISNCFSFKDLYNVEDDRLMKNIRSCYGKKTKKSTEE